MTPTNLKHCKIIFLNTDILTHEFFQIIFILLLYIHIVTYKNRKTFGHVFKVPIKGLVFFSGWNNKKTLVPKNFDESSSMHDWAELRISKKGDF